jgi:cell wall-associated NlpC family hydrolase
MKWLLAGVCTLAFALVGVATVLEDPPPAAATPPLAGTGGGLLPGSVPAQYKALVLRAGSLCAAAPPAVIAAQIQQESGWNPKAVSSAGAQGISQFLPSTWPHWSRPGESPFDPAAAILAQGRYDCALAKTMATAKAHDRLPKSFDVTSAMLASYNAGPTAVLTAHGVPQNGQTPGYVQAILASAPGFAGATVAGLIPGSFAESEIATAKQYLGTPYAWDGGGYLGPTQGQCVAGPAANDCNTIGFDCSGLVMRAVFVASGGRIRLPHSADAQTRGGTPVPMSQLEPGDLISFTNPGEHVAHHIGIYLGDDQLLNAPESGATVRVDSLDTPYYRGQSWRAVRYG